MRTKRGGSASCTSRGALDFYGRFDVSYNEALKNWLGSQGGSGTGGTGVAPIENILRVLRTLRAA